MIRPSSITVLSVISDFTAFEYNDPYINTHKNDLSLGNGHMGRK